MDTTEQQKEADKFMKECLRLSDFAFPSKQSRKPIKKKKKEKNDNSYISKMLENSDLPTPYEKVDAINEETVFTYTKMDSTFPILFQYMKDSRNI